MIVVVLFFDMSQGLIAAIFGIVGLVPGIGLIIGAFGAIFESILGALGFLTFYIWYKLRGVSFTEGGLRKLVTFLGGAFIEIVPFLNALPALTVSVILMILIVKREDARYNKSVARRSAANDNVSRVDDYNAPAPNQSRAA